MHRQPEGRGLLSPPSDGVMQKGQGSNGNKRTIHEVDGELDRRFNLYSISRAPVEEDRRLELA